LKRLLRKNLFFPTALLILFKVGKITKINNFLARLYQLATQRSTFALTVYRANQHGLPLETVIRAGFTYRLCRLKPRASRCKGASRKLWYA